MKTSRPTHIVAVVATVGIAVAACSSSGSTTTPPASSGGTAHATTAVSGASASGPTPSTSGSSSRATTTTPTVQASTSTLARFGRLTGGSTGLEIDTSFFRALSASGIKPSLRGHARARHDSFLFPISGGRLTVFRSAGSNQGTIEHAGSGFTLAAGKVKLDFTHMVVDVSTQQLRTTVNVDGHRLVSAQPLLDLDLAHMDPPTVRSGGAATLSGIRATLDPAAAAALDSAFATSVFHRNQVVATVQIEATGN